MFISIPDVETLASVYMPFINNGGLFIPGSVSLDLGDHVFLLLRLIDDKKVWPVCASVTWCLPDSNQGNRKGGAGVGFSDRDNRLKERIEDLLAKRIGQDRKAAGITTHSWMGC